MRHVREPHNNTLCPTKMKPARCARSVTLRLQARQLGAILIVANSIPSLRLLFDICVKDSRINRSAGETGLADLNGSDLTPSSCASRSLGNLRSRMSRYSRTGNVESLAQTARTARVNKCGINAVRVSWKKRRM